MRSERGSVTLVAAAVIFLVLVLGAGLAVVASVVNGRAMAVTAADAAALGAAPATFPPLGLDSPGVVADRLATENKAALVSCSCPVDATWSTRDVTVEVEVVVTLPVLGPRRIRAMSRAEFAPVALVAP